MGTDRESWNRFRPQWVVGGSRARVTCKGLGSRLDRHGVEGWFVGRVYTRLDLDTSWLVGKGGHAARRAVGVCRCGVTGGGSRRLVGLSWAAPGWVNVAQIVNGRELTREAKSSRVGEA